MNNVCVLVDIPRGNSNMRTLWILYRVLRRGETLSFKGIKADLFDGKPRHANSTGKKIKLFTLISYIFSNRHKTGKWDSGVQGMTLKEFLCQVQ